MWMVTCELPMKKDVKRCAADTFIIAAILTFLNHISLNASARIIMIWIMRMVYTSRNYSGTHFESIVWPSNFMIILFCAERIAFNLVALMGVENLSLVLTAGRERYLAAIIYLVICYCGVLVITKTKRFRIELPPSYQLLFMLFIYCSLVCANILSDYMLIIRQMKITSYYLISEAAFLLLVGMVLIFIILIWKVVQVHMERNQLLLERQKENSLKKKYEINKQSLETMQSWKHDYMNHLQAILSLIKKHELEAAVKYIEDLQNARNYKENSINIGDIVLDVILTSKMEATVYKGLQTI